MEKWIKKNGETLSPNKYIADIGFSIRKDTLGGGAVLRSDTMKKLSDFNMDIYFSEYNIYES